MRPVAPSILKQVSALLAIAWRRRKLIILPILLGVPLSLMAASIAPRTYVARTMFLLQEGSNDLPLARELRVTETSNEKVGGLRALLRSERVLGEAAKELYGAEVRNDPKRLAQRRKELEDRISMWSEAPDFIELRLNGTEPVGLGKTLEIIASKLLETVLTSGSGASLAPQMVIARLTRQIAETQARLDRLPAAGLAVTAPAPGPSGAPSPTAQDRAEDLQLARDELGVLMAQLGAPQLAPDQSQLWIATQTQQALKDLMDLQAAGTRGEPREATRARVVALHQAALAQALVAARRRDAGSLPATDRAGRSPFGATSLRSQLEAELAAAKLALQAISNRFSNPTGTSGPSFLRAPERIMVIDPPKDPDLPTRSRAVLVLAGVLCSILLGAGSAALAELLDTRIRSASDLLTASGTELLGRLPSA